MSSTFKSPKPRRPAKVETAGAVVRVWFRSNVNVDAAFGVVLAHAQSIGRWSSACSGNFVAFDAAREFGYFEIAL
jgi:hypothetical protein